MDSGAERQQQHATWSVPLAVAVGVGVDVAGDVSNLK